MNQFEQNIVQAQMHQRLVKARCAIWGLDPEVVREQAKLLSYTTALTYKDAVDKILSQEIAKKWGSLNSRASVAKWIRHLTLNQKIVSSNLTACTGEKPNMSTNEYMRKYMLTRYHKRRKMIIDQLGGKCSECGSTEDLQVDHINPADKQIDLGSIAGTAIKFIQEEIKKCQLLCATCHNLKTLRDLGRPNARETHGTLSSYKYCRCDLCKKAKSNYMKEYNRTYQKKRGSVYQ